MVIGMVIVTKGAFPISSATTECHKKSWLVKIVPGLRFEADSSGLGHLNSSNPLTPE
jgi:hypothetical protein